MSIPTPLSEKEIKDIYEGGHMMEAITIYGWDRIVTTLVAYNVLKKRDMTWGLDDKVYKACPLCGRPKPIKHPWNEPEAIAEHRASPEVIMVCKTCGRDMTTWARKGDGACTYCYGDTMPASTER